MPLDHAQPTGDDHQVLPFRPRNRAPSQPWPRRARHEPEPNDLARYEGDASKDNYRHRMLVNLAGLAFTIVLATAGAWLAASIADMRKHQDCYLSGRRNCAPIDVEALHH